MSETAQKLITAFLTGTVATAAAVGLIRLLPVPRYMKDILSFILPIPSVCVVLVLLFYGPADLIPIESFRFTRDSIKTFLIGSLTAFLFCVACDLWRRRQGGEDGEGTEE